MFRAAFIAWEVSYVLVRLLHKSAGLGDDGLERPGFSPRSVPELLRREATAGS